MNSLKKIILSTACAILLFGTAQAQETLKSETSQAKKTTNFSETVKASTISLVGAAIVTFHGFKIISNSLNRLKNMGREITKQGVSGSSFTNSIIGVMGIGIGTLTMFCGINHLWKTYIEKKKFSEKTSQSN